MQTILSQTDLNMNDPITFSYYTDLLIFREDPNRETYVFPTSTLPSDRRIIHTLAHHMGLEHKSEGNGEHRQVMILKSRPNITPQASQLPSSYYNESRRGLNRAATIDFSETREMNSGYYNHTLGRQGSGLLDIPGSPGLGGLNAAQNLRGAKSFADLRSYTPSPVPSSASFPVHLSQNVARYNEYVPSSAASGTPNLTPTSAGGINRDEAFILNGIGNMNLGMSNNNRSNIGRIGQERDHNAGPIGSQRPMNGNYDDNLRNGATAVPERQPRGPGADWGNGFRPRQNGQNGHANRGSGELDLRSVEREWGDNRG